MSISDVTGLSRRTPATPEKITVFGTQRPSLGGRGISPIELTYHRAASPEASCCDLLGQLAAKVGKCFDSVPDVTSAFHRPL
jgi:hypothetical protein